MQLNSDPDSETDPATAQRRMHLQDWLPFRLFMVATRSGDLLANLYGPHYGINRAEWRTLAVVANYPACSAKEIRTFGDMDQFTVSRAIGRLVELGFASRLVNDSDRRQACVALTERGYAVFDHVAELAMEIEGNLLDGLTEAEKAALMGILTKLEDMSAILRSRWPEHIAAVARPK
jgi:DNA-binding MarR family transcriptional regulator